jgi:hypothetical protein
MTIATKISSSVPATNSLPAAAAGAKCYAPAPGAAHRLAPASYGRICRGALKKCEFLISLQKWSHLVPFFRAMALHDMPWLRSNCGLVTPEHRRRLSKGLILPRAAMSFLPTLPAVLYRPYRLSHTHPG